MTEPQSPHMENGCDNRTCLAEFVDFGCQGSWQTLKKWSPVSCQEPPMRQQTLCLSSLSPDFSLCDMGRLDQLSEVFLQLGKSLM